MKRALTALGAALVLVACGSESSEPETKPSAAESSQSSKTPEPDGSAADLTFAAGAELTEKDLTEWLDNMVANDEYESLEPDNGQGRWSYTHKSTKCDVGFTQTMVQGMDPKKSDAVLSDDFIAQQFKVDATAVTRQGKNDQLKYGLGGQGTIDFRSLEFTRKSGTREMVFSRAFGSVGNALMVSISCSDPTTFTEAVEEIEPELAVAELGRRG